jgi:TonB-dependent receptor
VFVPNVVSSTVLCLVITSTVLRAQVPTGAIAGHVADTAGAPVAASLRVLQSPAHAAYADAKGNYTITNVPAGAYRVEVRFPGYLTDTFDVAVIAKQTTQHDVVMQPKEQQLAKTGFTTAGFAETDAGALETEKAADNIVSVISADDIGALPNYNAADAAARLPAVAAQRSEGEGSFLEIRGTPPDFQHVTIDGADVPGTLAFGARAVKLDDIPASLLGSVEVSKTLTADQDANAIGGSVNLLSKIPEGAPHGYVSGTFGYEQQESDKDGQGSFTYGGRVGAHQQLGFLLSGAYDRIDRTIQDVEPTFTAVAQTPLGGPNSFYAVPFSAYYAHYYPSEFSQREYELDRQRYGLSGDLDYRFSPTASVSLTGMWSAFFDQANRWETNLTGTGNANGGDTVLANGASVTNGTVSSNATSGGPVEHTWGLVAQAKNQLGPAHMTYTLDYAGSESTIHNQQQDDYSWNQPSFAYAYNQSPLTPTYTLPTGVAAAIANPGNYALSRIETTNEANAGQDVGGKIDASIPYSIGKLPATLSLGVKYRDEHKGYWNLQPEYNTVAAPGMSSFLSNYTVSGYYSQICQYCYTLAPFGSTPAAQQYFQAHPANFTGVPGQLLMDNLSDFAGTEQVAAAYAMHTMDIGPLHINAGLRVENTTIGYVAHAMTSPTDTTADDLRRAAHSYFDLFPSLLLRYAIEENTTVRASVTRGIARPDYDLLAPFVNAVGAERDLAQSPITEGNPYLKPEYAWNFDLMAQHFFPSAGVLSAGFFYKDLHDFIFPRLSPYTGTNPAFADSAGHQYYVSQYQNGPNAELWGVEVDGTEHFTFLPGIFSGLGVDLNWTHTESRARIPLDTLLYYVTPIGDTIRPYNQPYRHAALDRTIPTLLNLALLYDRSTISLRVAEQYSAAAISSYGLDGSSNPTSSDSYFYPHWQLDAQLTWRVFGRTALTVAAQNITNEYFGYFTGTLGNRSDSQRETYGSVWLVGIRQGF